MRHPHVRLVARQEDGVAAEVDLGAGVAGELAQEPALGARERE
jgi:hypothetical protein